MKRWFFSFFIGIGIALLFVAIWRTQVQQGPKLAAFEREPQGIMGTSCRLVVVMDYRKGAEAKKILDKGEFQLRYIESLASNWIKESELSQFNLAEVGLFYFSKVNWEMIQSAREAFEMTHGAFDVTCRPLIELWKAAGKSGVLPTDEQLLAARNASDWDDLEFVVEEQALLKKAKDLSLDLGGIAKGYGIDRALEAMADLGPAGVMVDVGGDIRVFGTSARSSGRWVVGIKDPQGEGTLGSFEMEGGLAVCTSGNYARYAVIEGHRYSHIVDPVTGFPTTMVPSVTVIASETLLADVWATALSVLGKQGLELLPEGVDAQMIVKEADGDLSKIFQSDGFPGLLDSITE